MLSTTIFWKRTDVCCLERVHISPDRDAAKGVIITVENGGAEVRHHWQFADAWQVLALNVQRCDDKGEHQVHIERQGQGWTVHGQERPELDGAELVDLSLTPFCNTFPISRMLNDGLDTAAFDTVYIDGDTLKVSRSRQAYDQLDAGHFRYRDLGLSSGFQAHLRVDRDGIVAEYEGLFKRVDFKP
ncbi:MAG: putative glycolipid-binding domain-containing protein [Pseudorhizobium sp.]